MLSDRPQKVDMRLTSSVKKEALSNIKSAYQPLSSKQLNERKSSQSEREAPGCSERGSRLRVCIPLCVFVLLPLCNDFFSYSPLTRSSFFSPLWLNQRTNFRF